MAIWGLWSALIPTGPCCGHDMKGKKCERAFEMDFWLAVTLIRSQIPQSDPLCRIISLYYILAGEKFKSLDLNSLILSNILSQHFKGDISVRHFSCCQEKFPLTS
jgi:hypothetical protein